MRLLEQRGDFFIRKSCDAAADASYEECQFWVMFGELDELVHIRTDGVNAALHRRDGIALTLQTNALTHDGSKLAVGDVSRTSAVHPLQVAAEHKDFVWLQRCDKFWCYSLIHKQTQFWVQIYELNSINGWNRTKKNWQQALVVCCQPFDSVKSVSLRATLWAMRSRGQA